VLLFGPPPRTPGGASVIWPRAALGHGLLLERGGSLQSQVSEVGVWVFFEGWEFVLRFKFWEFEKPRAL